MAAPTGIIYAHPSGRLWINVSLRLWIIFPGSWVMVNKLIFGRITGFLVRLLISYKFPRICSRTFMLRLVSLLLITTGLSYQPLPSTTLPWQLLLLRSPSLFLLPKTRLCGLFRTQVCYLLRKLFTFSIRMALRFLGASSFGTQMCLLRCLFCFGAWCIDICQQMITYGLECTVVSMCSLCEKAAESAEHLFLACPFTQGLWNWLMGTLCCNIDLTSFETVLYTCNKNWSKQVGVVVLATILNVFLGNLALQE